MDTSDVIVIGGGAAGLMCAAVAGARGRRVLVLEGSKRVGKKILMSGGGRCNFTNLHTSPANFLSANPHFCKSALSRYRPQDFVALVEAYGIDYYEKKAGQLFCTESAKAILAMLLAECDQSGVRILTDCAVRSVALDGAYRVTVDETTFEAPALVVATGGLSIPKMGASDLGYRIARRFGLVVRDPCPGLVPFTLGGRDQQVASRLTGISLPVRIETGSVSFDDDLLFTHRGLSGPAVLQLSSYWIPGQTVSVDLMPQTDVEALLQDARRTQPRAVVRTVLARHLPRALVLEWQQRSWSEVAERPLAELGNAQLQQIAASVQHWSLEPSGTEGYRTAEVTLGGVATSELSSQTLEAERQRGLYFIGEVVDVTGHLGGHNFQWAWASAQAAGSSL